MTDWSQAARIVAAIIALVAAIVVAGWTDSGELQRLESRGVEVSR